MRREDRSFGKPRVVWVYAAAPSVALGKTTRLEITRALRGQGWDITLLMQGPAGIRDVDGVEILSFPKPKLYFIGYCLFHIRVLRFLAQKRAKFDVVLFHAMSAPWLLPLRLARGLADRQMSLLVMDTRDLVPIGADLKTQLRILFHRLVHWLANHGVDGQTAITRRMAELVNIPKARLWGIWPSGVNLERFGQARSSRTWPSNDDPVHMVYVGALYRERNLLHLCGAVEQANALGTKIILSIVGSGPDRIALETFASEGEGAIRIQEAVPHGEIPGLLAQAHIGVTSLPEANNEKFGASSPIKLFEYIAAGLPILSTRNPCHLDVVGDGSYAFWAADESEESLVAAIRDIWDSRLDLSAKGEQALRDAEHWTWEQAAMKLATAIEAGFEELEHSE